ncbi:hypothetical protein BD769DRAFT_1389754 [Suillus cothurnatus]|nr:hypothetical protein BD769DRAFT_1389754 [Suillus cothurnatus]
MKQFDARGKYRAPETQILSIKLGLWRSVGGRIISAGKHAGNSQKRSHSVIITEMVRVQGMGVGGCGQAQLSVVGLGGHERCVRGVQKVWKYAGEHHTVWVLALSDISSTKPALKKDRPQH